MNSLIQIFKKMHSSLFNKYLITNDDYNKIIITNILYNEKTNIVCCFKEYLLYDDPGEFLKRFYNLEECYDKIKSYCEFYEKNSKIFPNYVPLPESKYIFKNIKKKQKMLDNINEDNNKEEFKESNLSYSKIFTQSIMNSILSEKKSVTLQENSMKKLLKFITDNESINKNSKDNFSDSSGIIGQSKFIENYSNIEYNIKGKTYNTGRHHYKKFIKDFQIEKPLIPKKIIDKNSEFKKTINNNSNSKNNSIKLQTKKYIPKINIDNMIKSLNIKITNNNRKKDKSKIKGKEIFTERNIKPIGIQKVSISKGNKKKKNIMNKMNLSSQNNVKKEAKSMPKLSISLNKSTGINNKNISFHKQLFSIVNKIPQKFNNSHYININNNINNNIINNMNNNNYNINNNNNIKSSLKFTNIKLQKPTNNFNIEIQFHNTNVNTNNYISKHIPSLQISLNTNFKNTSTLSKSKSKSKSNSKSKSKSPNSTSNSLNKNFKHNIINSFNKNFKYFNNNIRALIHKDIIFNSGEGLQTERIKHKIKVSKIKNTSLTQKNKNLNNNNIFKRNIHKKIISSTTSSSEYTKIIPKTSRENFTNFNNPSKNKIIKSNIRLKNKNVLEEKKRLYSDSQKILKTPINKSTILQNINSINKRKNKIKNSNSSNRNNNSYKYRRHPMRKIKSNERTKKKKSPLNKPNLPNKSVLSNVLKK